MKIGVFPAASISFRRVAWAVAALGFACAWSQPAVAQLTWTAGTNRTWDTTSGNWAPGPVAWTANSNAIFDTTASVANRAITVSGTQSVGRLTVSSTNYSFTGGALRYTQGTSGTWTFQQGATINSGLTATLSDGNRFFIATTTNDSSGTLTITGSVTIQGSGTSWFNPDGRFAFSGSTLTLQDAGLRLGSNNGASYRFENSTVSITGSQTSGFNRGISMAAGTITVVSSTISSPAALIGNGGGGTLTMTSGLLTTGTLQFLPFNGTSVGNLNLDGGVIELTELQRGGDSTGATTTVNLNFNGGTLRALQNNTSFINVLSGTVITNGRVLAGGARFDTNGFDITVSQPLVSATANDGGLVKLSAGTLTLSASNGYLGATAINGGVLLLSNSNALAGGGTISFGGGTLQFSSSNTQDYSSRIKSSGSAISIDTNSQAVPFTAALDSTNTGGLTKLGSGTLTLSGSSGYLGTTTISAGVLQIGSSGTTGSLGTGAVTNNANLTFSRTDDYGGAVSNTMSGTGSLTLSSGTLTLSGGTANTSSGLTTVNAGVLQLNKTAGVNAIGGNVQVNAGATLRLSAANQIADTGTVTLTAGTWNLSGQNETITSLSGTASGGVAPTVTLGSGTLSLNSISYTGTAGSASTSFGAGTLRFVPNGSTQPTFTTSYINNVDISSAVQIDAASVSFNLGTYGSTISGKISGTGSLIKGSQGGLLTLSGSNDYSGGTQWTGAPTGDYGQFSANATGALGTGTVTLSGGSQVTYTNQSADPSAFIFAGGTTTQANAFKLAATSVISVSNPKGTQASTDAVLLTGGFDLGGNTLFVRGRGTGTISGPISGSGGITKIDALGTWALTGTNTFTGATTISNGILSFGGTSALGSTSGVTINGGAGLTYTGGAATFSRNVTVTAGSGTGTIRNSGGGLLTLSGSLSKDNSILRLTGGRFNITGVISGTAANASDLLLDGTSTVTLSAVNTYSGPTFVNQASNLVLGVDNAIPNNSTVTLGNATTTGTLTLGSFSDSIGQLVFSGSGGTLAMAAATTASVQLVTGSSLTLGSNARLDLTGSGTAAGLYRLVSASSLTGTFAAVTGLNSNYVLRYGTVNANEIDAQRKADQAATFTMTAPARALVNTSVAVSGTVTNSSPVNSTALTLGLASTGLTGSGFTTGSVSGGSSLAVSGTLGAGPIAGTQNWSITNTDNSAITTLSTATGSLQVVNQREFTVTGGTMSLGTFLRPVGATGSATISSSGLYASTATASLAAFSGTNTGGFSLALASGSATFAGAQATQQAVYALSGSAASAGVINGSFTSSVTAEFGSIAPLSVLLTGTALDPATAQLAYGGTADGMNWTINLGEFNQSSGTSSAVSFGISNLTQTAGFTADLFLASLSNPTNSGAIFTDLTGTSAFATLVAGGTNSFSAWMSLATTGSFTNVYNLAFNSSKNGASLGGTPQNVTLTVTGVIVVPEPGGVLLALLGAAGAAWLSRQRRA